MNNNNLRFLKPITKTHEIVCVVYILFDILSGGVNILKPLGYQIPVIIVNYFPIFNFYELMINLPNSCIIIS